MATIRIPTFIGVGPSEQCQQLLAFLNELKPSLNLKPSDELTEDIKKAVDVCDVVFTSPKEAEVEPSLNSVVTLLFEVPTQNEKCKYLVQTFCENVLKAPSESTAASCLRVMKNLYDGLFESTELQYVAYITLVKLANKTNQLSEVFDSLASVKSKFNISTVGVESTQNLYRLLHSSLIASGRSKLASQVMIELLGTYTEENASHAKQDAMTCITSFLKDPNTFLMDHLLTLKPVKFLEGEPIHDLLTIFVSEKLQDYLEFYSKNIQVIENLGLVHEQNMKKMRLLTFMQMAESKKEISYETICEELQLEHDNVEPFVIDVLRTKLVRAKVDQLGRKVLVQSTMHRTFGRPQWQQLRDILSDWKNNFTHVEQTIKTAIKQNVHG
ncbi:Eukaryotic translation initiation factor 3 subunit M, partial [Fragariocoptes setiger]